MSSAKKLQIGTRVRWDGDDWRVVAFRGSDVELESRTKRRSIVEIRSLVEAQGFKIHVTDPADGEGESRNRVEFLDGVPEGQVARAKELEAHVLEVLTGFRLGSAAVSLDGEPRSEYDPSTLTTSQRIEQKAKELGVIPGTIWRYIERYRREGLRGLLDRRVGKLAADFPSVDDRLKRTILVVLDDLVGVSRLSKAQVRRKVERELRVRYPDEDIKVPSRKTFNALLDRLDAGRGTFGHAKGKRERANQPKLTYRPLEVVRPGEAIVIDATPLDAYAIDPLNLAWSGGSWRAAPSEWSRRSRTTRRSRRWASPWRSWRGWRGRAGGSRWRSRR